MHQRISLVILPIPTGSALITIPKIVIKLVTSFKTSSAGLFAKTGQPPNTKEPPAKRLFCCQKVEATMARPHSRRESGAEMDRREMRGSESKMIPILKKIVSRARRRALNAQGRQRTYE